MELMSVNKQWATRPDDERFTSLTELNDFALKSALDSYENVVNSKQLTVAPVEDDPSHKALAILGPNGKAVSATNWAFSQLCGITQTRHSYLKRLPAPLVADCLNYTLQHEQEDGQDVGVLVGRSDRAPVLRAITGPRYGRIWNHRITDVLVSKFGNGLDGAFRIPGEFGQRVPVTKANTTLYASDRDMFVFLADEEHRIEMPNRRDGKTGSLARGFIISNSEVGAGTCWIALFLFDYVCGNRIVWGVQEYQEVRIRHNSYAMTHFTNRVLPAISAYANSATTGVVDVLAAAQKARLDDVDKFLASRSFTRPQIAGIKAAHLEDEGRPIETIWDATTAVTAYARVIPYQDKRVALEREGGKILQVASLNRLQSLDVDFTDVEED